MIDVRRTGPNAFAVTIRENSTETHHAVTLSDAAWRRLGDGKHTPEACIEAAFRFLLDHEPKDSILRSFDLMVIARYFPQFESELPRYF